MAIPGFVSRDPDAQDVAFDNTSTGLSGTDLQTVGQELDSDVAAVEGDVSTLQSEVVVLQEAPWGKDFIQQSKAVSETVTGGNFVVYDELIFNVTAGTIPNKYRLNVEFFWGHNQATNDIRVQALLDGVLLKEFRKEPKDAGADQREQNSILSYAVDLADGNHTFTLQYRPASAARVSRMFFSEFEVWRVS